MDNALKTIFAYDQNADAFAGKFMEYPPYLERIKEFISSLDGGEKVLDLGCGPGNMARQLVLSGKGYTITGVDLSEEMLRIARENVPEASFFCQDIREINFKPNSFDVILLSFCIVHLKDKEMVSLLEKVSQYLKAGGKVYLSFMEGKTAGFETTSFSREEIYFHYHTAERVGEVLTQNGIPPFKVVKQGYPEMDGTITTDVFIYGGKPLPAGPV